MSERYKKAVEAIRAAAAEALLPSHEVEFRMVRQDVDSLKALLLAKKVATMEEISLAMTEGMELELAEVRALIGRRKADAEEMAARAKAAAEAEARAKLEEEQKAIEAWAEVQRAKIERQAAEQRAKLAGANAEPKPAE